MKKGIIVASFGTSYKETRERCIESIENKITDAFGDYEVMRAFTSNMVIRRIKEKESIDTHTVETAIQAMVDQGIKKIYIQPLHIIPGFEYHKIRRAVSLANHKKDLEVVLGTPLLNEEEDYDQVVAALENRLPSQKENEGIVLMGHGTEHPANACYSMLQMKLMDVRSDIYIANVEGYPELDHILPKVKDYSNLTLMPLMIVAGDHAQNDMAGDDEDSYKSVLTEEGKNVDCILAGLGELSGIQEIFVNRLKALIEK